jgi:CBS domain-containing protein
MHLVHNIMKRRHPVVAGPDETAEAAAARMMEAACGSILVCDGGQLCGIFTERDLMTHDPDRIESTATAREALWRMDELGYRHLPVMEDGRVLGVVSMRDLPIETVAEMLPELERRRVLTERLW